MNTKRTRPTRSRARKATVQPRRRAPNTFPLATRRLAKRLLQFAELPEPKRTRAYNTWLNSAGSPKRTADRQNRVREFYSLMKAIAKKLSPCDRASMRALGKAILAKAARSQRSQRPTAPLRGKRLASP
jgi:hypothetical protein